MPAKKKTPRSASKSKRAKTRADKTVKKNIARAVERIPQMIIKEVGLKEFAPQSPQVIDRPERIKRPLFNKHALMWTGVVMLSSVVFVMWFLNTRQALAALRQSPPSQERQLLETARTDLRDIMQRVAAAETNEFTEAVDAAAPAAAKAAVKSALGLFLTLTPASAASSTTSATATTT